MSIKELVKRVGDVEYKIEIDYDEFADSPREYSEHSKLAIRKHRGYDFPNELEFDFDAFYTGNMELPTLEENQKLFWLDFYEHGSIHFSLAGEGMQCGFNTRGKCGFIIAGDAAEAKAEIEEYNSYLNGECYILEISARDTYTDVESGKRFTTEWESLDCMGCIGWDNLEWPIQYPFEEGEWEKFISN